MKKKFEHQVESLRRQGIKPLFYYIRENLDYKLSVCLLKQEGKVVARGIAICSHQDSFNKREGRMIAWGRAMKAYYNQKSTDEISLDFSQTDWPEEEEFEYKSEYLPERFTELEQKILSRKVK